MVVILLLVISQSSAKLGNYIICYYCYCNWAMEVKRVHSLANISPGFWEKLHLTSRFPLNGHPRKLTSNLSLVLCYQCSHTHNSSREIIS